MKPILFASNATQFDTNGIGRLDCISCVVVEERNGEYTLTMEIAETALHVSDIQVSSIIVVKPSDGASLQAFRVYKITKPIGGRFTVLADHISYQLSYIPAMPFSVPADANACANTLSSLKRNAAENCPFTFSTDVKTVASYTQTVPASIRSRLGGVEGSVLDQFGGEYEWDNYNVILHNHRGRITPVLSLRYGKNITDLTQEENIQNTVTGIVPYWISTDSKDRVTLPEKVVNGRHASSFPFKRTVPMDFSQDFQEKPSENQLRTKAQAYVNASGVGVPEVSIKLSFINLSDTEEYKNIAAFQSVKLCDNVEVYFEKLGIATTAQIVKTEYDVLLEKYNSVEIGSLRSTLASVMNAQDGALAQVANDTRRMFQNYGIEVDTEIQEQIDNATKWLRSADGVIMAKTDEDTGAWTDLFFMSQNATAARGNVLRINVNGLGFSSTGWDGPFTQAWTLDGQMIIGGTNVPSLTVYENGGTSGNIIFKISKKGMRWSAANSSMSETGDLTLTAGSINIGNGKFVVTTAGALTAISATIKGDIQSGSTITGANIYGGTLGIGVKLNGYYFNVDSDGNLNINDTFKVSNDGTVTITKGSITISNKFAVDSNGNFSINGDVFKIDSDGNVKITKGSINIGNGNFEVKQDGTLTAKAGTFKGSLDINGKFKVDNDGNLSINSDKFKVDNSGNLSINNDIFKVTNDGNVAINKGSINLGNGVFVVDNNGKVTVSVSGDSRKTIIDNGYIKTWYLGITDERNDIQGAWTAHDSLNHTLLTGAGIDVGYEYNQESFFHNAVTIYATCHANAFDDMSDRRVKKNIKDIVIEKAKNFIMALKPKRFQFNKRCKNSDDSVHHGFIAQDVEKIADWDVVTNRDDGMKGIIYTEIIADLVAVVQDQERRINDLERRLNENV